MVLNNSINAPTPFSVDNGGLGGSSLTPYAPICGGTTTTGPVQSIASVGTAAQVLTSNGPAALPSMQDASAGGEIGIYSVSLGGTPIAEWVITDLDEAGAIYRIHLENYLPDPSAAVSLYAQVSVNNGSSYLTSGYQNAGVGLRYDGGSVTIDDDSNSNIDFNGNRDIGGAGMGGALIHLFNPYSTTEMKHLIIDINYVDSTGEAVSVQSSQSIETTSQVNAIRFYFSSGNITWGKVRVFKISGG